MAVLPLICMTGCGDYWRRPPAPIDEPLRSGLIITFTPTTDVLLSRSKRHWVVALNKAGTSVQLAATFHHQGQPDPEFFSKSIIKWRTSDIRVAQVSASGLLTGISNGRASVTATEGRAWWAYTDRIEVLVGPEQ
jgi:uncharacterized protein YjdB